MTETAQEKLDRLADATATQAADSLRTRRGWTITKFGRHDEGYFHARVTVDGKPFYMHLRFGSWMVPGTFRGRSLLKEPESLGIPFDAKEELCKRVASVLRSERKGEGDGKEGQQDESPDQPAGHSDGEAAR